MNATASIAGGAPNANASKSTFSKSVYNYFKGSTQTFTNIQVAPSVQNKNLKMFVQREEDEIS